MSVRTITVVVTAQDGTTRKTYTVAVTRATAAGIQGMTHTINVGAPSNNDPQLFIWTPIPRLAVPGALMANGQTAYLEFLEITNWPYIAIRMSSAQSGSPAASQAGPDFTPSFEQSGIMRFVASDGSQVEFTGIGDSAEPYGWWVRGPSDRANASAWITRVNGLTDKTCRLQLVAPASTTPANQAPTANAGRDQSVSAGALVTLSGSGSDPDSGDTLTYSWTQIGTPAVTLSNSWISNPTFNAPRPSATLTFRLTVTDNHGASDTDDVTITVRAPARTNRAPTANAGSNQTVSLGATVTLRGSGMDPDRDTLSYSWLQTRGSPTVNLSGANTATASFTAPNNLPLGGAE